MEQPHQPSAARERGGMCFAGMRPPDVLPYLGALIRSSSGPRPAEFLFDVIAKSTERENLTFCFCTHSEKLSHESPIPVSSLLSPAPESF